MSIFSILKSDTFASTLQTFSGKAREVVDTVSKNMPSSVQGIGDKARDVAGSVSKNIPGSLQGLGDKAKGVAETVSQNMPKNAATAFGIGSLVALFGTMLPKDVVKGAALVGAGAIAWNFYQKWSAQKTAAGQAPAEAGAAQQALPSPQDPAAMLMLRAMVYAARADGHIDEAEQSRISKLTEQFLPGQDTNAIVNTLVNEPLNLELLASQMQSVEQREDLYRLSCLVLDIDHFMERSYLDALAKALGIEARQAELEQEALAAKQQLDAMS
ncbi:MAG TPA: DUF533 domain-containing protein [Candidatus Desulfovibrio intestinipullorum]|uniref:DUF533 domain-containing protein n=1 Tax=Candidatus Desulfovibrio intestinipullorum TaxID=2838536 RepID=A0A9D1PXE6_9BACT|nr:DUF533 domain-containing protein [Candidatus Desulfovibrio intestinipullorum]